MLPAELNKKDETSVQQSSKHTKLLWNYCVLSKRSILKRSNRPIVTFCGFFSSLFLNMYIFTYSYLSKHRPRIYTFRIYVVVVVMLSYMAVTKKKTQSPRMHPDRRRSKAAGSLPGAVHHRYLTSLSCGSAREDIHGCSSVPRPQTPR